LFFSFLVSTWLAASEDIYLSGFIEDMGHINMFLRINDQRISGWYRFSQELETRPLTGAVSQSDTPKTLYEVDTQQGRIAQFTGDWLEKEYSGIWLKDQKSYSFSLKQRMLISELSLVRSDQLNIRSHFPFFLQADEAATFNDLYYRQTMEDAGDFYRLFQDDEIFVAPYLSQSGMGAAYLGEQWISLIFDHYQYSGGAHGNSYWECDNYRKVEGKWIAVDINDLLRDRESMDILINILLDKLQQEGAAWAEEEEMLDKDRLLEDFTLGPPGITFFFEPYTVGPYAQGSYEVFLPWEDSPELWSENLSFLQPVD